MVAGVKDHVSDPQAAMLNLSSLPAAPPPLTVIFPAPCFIGREGAGIGMFLQLPFFCLLPVFSVC